MPEQLPIWMLVTMNDGETFVAQNHKEDGLTVVFTDVLDCRLSDHLGEYVVSVVTKMRYVNRSAIKYRDVIDDLVDKTANYEMESEVPWYFREQLAASGGLG